MKYLYYAVIDNEDVEYLEYEKEQTKEDFKSYFENYEASVEVYAKFDKTKYTNQYYDLIYKNHEIRYF